MSKKDIDHKGHVHKSKLGVMLCYVSCIFTSVMPILIVAILALSVHEFYNTEKKFKDLSVQVFEQGRDMNAKIALNNDKLDVISNRTKLALTVGGSGGGYISADQSDKIEKINSQASKYYVVVLTREIMDSIDNTENFKAKLDELEKSLEGKFPDYIAELRNYEQMNMMSFEEMATIVENATVADVPVEKDKGVIDNVRGLFKISNKDDLKIKCNPIVIDSAIKALIAKNEWEALQTIEKVEPKNEDLKKVLANLAVRNTIKFYARDIGDKVLKDA